MFPLSCTVINYAFSTVHRKILVGEKLVNHAGKSYWQGKIWQISKSVHMPYTFSVYL